MLRQNKKRSSKIIILVIFILLILAFIGAGGIYYFLFSNGKEESKIEGGGKVLNNPAKGLSLEEAVEKFNDEYIKFLLVAIKAGNLHNPPFSSDIPKIEISLGEEIYHGTVTDNKISVGKGQIEDEDIILYSSREEIVKIMKDKDYVKNSFENGLASIELKTDKLELYSKGYLDIYDELS